MSTSNHAFLILGSAGRRHVQLFIKGGRIRSLLRSGIASLLKLHLCTLVWMFFYIQFFWQLLEAQAEYHRRALAYIESALPSIQSQQGVFLPTVLFYIKHLHKRLWNARVLRMWNTDSIYPLYRCSCKLKPNGRAITVSFFAHGQAMNQSFSFQSLPVMYPVSPASDFPYLVMIIKFFLL